MTERTERAQCLIHRGDRVLLMRSYLPTIDREYWMLPGGGVEPGETPEEAAVRELKEECCVDGQIIKLLQTEDLSATSSVYDRYYTFLMDIGDQQPEIGGDPSVSEAFFKETHRELKFLTLKEIPERERVFLFSSGLLLVEEFQSEVLSWGNSISYPGGKSE